MSIQKNRFYSISILFVIIISFGVITPLSAADEESSDKLLVLINGDSITSTDMDKQIMKNHTAFQQMSKNGIEYRNLLTKLVNDYLILQEAYAIGMDEEEWIVNQLEEQISKRAIGHYLKDIHKPDMTITDSQLNKFFTDFYYKILIRTISTDSKVLADSIYNLISAGYPMDSLAQELSIDSRKFKSGLHKVKFYADTDTTLRKRAIQLEENEISKPFPFLSGYVVLRLEQKMAPDTNDLKMLTRKLTGMLKGQRRERLWNEFIDSLINLHSIDISEEILTEINSESAILFTDKFFNNSDSAAIIIDDAVKITESKLRKSISHTAMSNGDKQLEEISEMTIREILTEKVLTLETLAKNYHKTEQVIVYANNILDSLLIENYLLESIINKIKFNQEDFTAYYENNSDSFRNEEEYKFDQLIFSSEDSAKIYVDQINSGSSFEYIKKLVSPSKADEPEDVDWSPVSILPKYIQQDVKLKKPGQAIGPYSLKNGWLLLYLMDYKIGDIKPYAEVENSIRNVFFQKLFKENLDSHLEILKENSEIKYFEKEINKYFEE